MKIAKLKFKGKSQTIEITDSIYNLYIEREVKCGIAIDSFINRINEAPKGTPVMSLPELFEAHEDDFEDDELDNIIDGYFEQKGVELFDLNLDNIFIEYYNKDDSEDIIVVFEPTI